MRKRLRSLEFRWTPLNATGGWPGLGFWSSFPANKSPEGCDPRYRIGRIRAELGMNPELWRRTEELFQAALGLSPDARAAFLEKACGEDAGLRRHVELLLSNDEHGGSLLEKPILADVMPQHENEDSVLPTSAVNRVSASANPSRIGTRVGTYEF